MRTIAVFFTTLLTAVGAADSGFSPNLQGNLGLSGGGYGDVYAGKIKEGVYGAGGRIGGNIGINGGLGLGTGRKRRQAGILANGTGASSMTGAQNPNGAFSISGSSAGGTGTLNMNSFQIPKPGRKRRQAPAGILANGTGASSMTGAQNPNGAFSVSGSSAGGTGTLGMGNFQIPNVGRKRRQAPAGIQANGTGASSMTGAQNPNGAFSVSGSSASGTGTLGMGSFQIPNVGRKRRQAPAGILANGTGASSMTGAQNPNGAFSISGSSAGGTGTLNMGSFQIPNVGRKRRDIGMVANGSGASSMSGSQNPDGAFTVSGSATAGGTLSIGNFADLFNSVTSTTTTTAATPKYTRPCRGKRQADNSTSSDDKKEEEEATDQPATVHIDTLLSTSFPWSADSVALNQGILPNQQNIKPAIPTGPGIKRAGIQGTFNITGTAEIQENGDIIIKGASILDGNSTSY